MRHSKLTPHSHIQKPDGPVVLLIIDGVGIGRRDEYDALYLARTPTLDSLFQGPLYRTLSAHGTAVGLPSDADLGGSEVGHNVMGAGRVIDQGPTLVDNAFANDSVFKGDWCTIRDQLVTSGNTLHLIGLLSDGGIHSNQQHLFKLIDRAAKEGIARIRVHVLFDGRDVPDFTAADYASELENVLKSHRKDGRDYRIASGGGRMVSVMDRYNADWSIVKTGWDTIVHGEGPQFSSVVDAIANARTDNDDLSDQYLPAFVILDDEGNVSTVDDGDAVILFNFRGDRAVEMCMAFESGSEFEGFDRRRVPDVIFAGMMLYDGDLGVPARYLVTPMKTEGCLSELLAASGVSQFACAETQKFGHVTYFWNGNRSGKFDETLEEYVEIASDRCPFEQKPWMKAGETADTLIDAIETGRYQFIRANFAGGDMVGHSGRLLPTIVALESIELSVARVVDAVRKARGCLVVTADHGNAEDMVERDKSGKPLFDDDGRPRRRTAHSLNPVPFAIADFSNRTFKLRPIDPAGLGNIAPTLAELLGFKAPGNYTDSLIESA